MDSTTLKTDRILNIYSRLVNGDTLQKKGAWRSNFMSRNGVFSVTMGVAALFFHRAGVAARYRL